MRYAFTLLFLISITRAVASPQPPDYIIYKNDTLPVYSLILEEYYKLIKAPDYGQLFGLSFRSSQGLSCWRGYQAVYSIENDSLFLAYISECGELRVDRKINVQASAKKLTDLFLDKVVNGKVFIDWFSGDISLPVQQQLRWDGVFYNSFEKEIVVSSMKGHIKKILAVNNYIDDPRRINRQYKDKPADTMLSRLRTLDMQKLDSCDCFEGYIVTIGKNGRVKGARMARYKPGEIKEYWEMNEYRYCIKKVLRPLRSLRFDILKKAGKKIEEKIYVDVELLEE